MKRAVMVLLVAVMASMVGSVSANPTQINSRFWLASYDPPNFSMRAQLVESQTEVTIKYVDNAFSVDFASVQICAPGTLSPEELTVLSEALDFAVRIANAMPE